MLLITNILPALLRVLPPRAARAFKLHVVGANIVPASLSQLMKEHEDRCARGLLLQRGAV